MVYHTPTPKTKDQTKRRKAPAGLATALAAKVPIQWKTNGAPWMAVCRPWEPPGCAAFAGGVVCEARHGLDATP